jgi:hypothetical protein
MFLGDPQACRDRAAHCANRAATSASPIVREKFARLANTWLCLAIQLEEQSALLHEFGDYREEGISKKRA